MFRLYYIYIYYIIFICDYVYVVDIILYYIYICVCVIINISIINFCIGSVHTYYKRVKNVCTYMETSKDLHLCKALQGCTYLPVHRQAQVANPACRGADFNPVKTVATNSPAT